MVFRKWCKVQRVKVVPLAIGYYLEYLTQALPIIYEARPVEQMDYPVDSIQNLFRKACLNYKYIDTSTVYQYGTVLYNVLPCTKYAYPSSSPTMFSRNFSTSGFWSRMFLALKISSNALLLT